MHHDSNSYNKESEENFCEGVIDENYKLNEVYSQKPMITYHDLEILADGKLEKYCEAYNKFLYKILEKIRPWKDFLRSNFCTFGVFQRFLV